MPKQIKPPVINPPPPPPVGTSSVLSIDPVTRLEGHLKIEVTVDVVNAQPQVVDARAVGTMFRGLETILANRSPQDAPDITQRICGVCPVSHGMASVTALDKAANIGIPANARIMRNLVLGANFVQSHILHFYHLAALDFIEGPAMAPWQPSWNVDKRLPAGDTQTLVNHYVTALDMRRKAHEMGALFGGRLPHPPAFVPGGFTTTPRPERITKFKAYVTEFIAFIDKTYLPDVDLLERYYGSGTSYAADYAKIGRGRGNLLAYGVFDLDAAGQQKLLKAGQVVNGSTTVQPLDVTAITEQVTYSWYDNRTNNLAPAAGSVCIKIGAPNVVFDCQGFSVNGNHTTLTYGIGLNDSATNVTVQNCLVQGFEGGVTTVNTNGEYILGKTVLTISHHLCWAQMSK